MNNWYKYSEESAPEDSNITVICAWCKKIMKQGLEGAKYESHSICPKCKEKFTKDLQEERSREK